MKEQEPKSYIISEMSPYYLYIALCSELSFSNMVELYKLIKYKIESLEDYLYQECCCQLDRNESSDKNDER